MRSMLWTSVGLVPFLAGCLVIGGGRSIEIEEQERLSVSFASNAAAEAFYEGLAMSSRCDYTDIHGFAVPFLAIGVEAVFHETHHFNAQVRTADVDRDRSISEEEATSYLVRIRKVNEEESLDSLAGMSLEQAAAIPRERKE